MPLTRKLSKYLYVLSLLIKEVVKQLKKTILDPPGCEKKIVWVLWDCCIVPSAAAAAIVFSNTATLIIIVIQNG